MQVNRTLFVSIALNVVLLGWVIFLPGVRPRQADIPSNVIITTPPTAAALPKQTQRFATQPDVQSCYASFDWRQVESEDYKQYIANLRAIGCPEKTIKDIIAADVNDLFTSRQAAITRSNHYEYWRATPVNLTEEQKKQLSELTKEKIEALKALGVESGDFAVLFADYYRNEIGAHELELDFLSESKRKQVNALRFQAYQQMLVAGEGSPNAVEIDQQADLAMKALLTPEELHEYEIRTSTPATQLRSVMNNLEATEKEFRTIYDFWNKLQAEPSDSLAYREAQQSSEATLRQLLGSNRFEIYLQGAKSWGYAR